MGEVDYVVSIAGRRKTERVVHVNLLKIYLTRESEMESVLKLKVMMLVAIADNKGDSLFLQHVVLDYLEVEQVRQLMQLFMEYREVFSYNPGNT